MFALKWMTTGVRRHLPSDPTRRVSGPSTPARAAAAWVLGDPRAEALLDEMAWSRMPAGAAAVRTPESAAGWN